jgi:uncharacterized protein (DUF1697 family)
MRYVAFLRGINVGGRKAVKMADLKVAFENLGYTDVQTVQASGNVVFAAADVAPAVAAPGGSPAGGPADVDSLADRIEIGLRQAFGYSIGVVVRSLDHLERLVASDPFKGVAMTPETRLYVTFLTGPGRSGTEIDPKTLDPGSAMIPAAARGGLRVVRIAPEEVLTAITLAPGWGTTELMAWLEKGLGRDVTTRNWNTVRRITGW